MLSRLNENEYGGKKKKYLQKTNDGKVILRKAMSKHIPQDIHQAVKQGFSSPDQSWFKGESIEFVKAKLLNDNANIYKYMAVQYRHSLIILYRQFKYPHIVVQLAFNNFKFC